VPEEDAPCTVRPTLSGVRYVDIIPETWVRRDILILRRFKPFGAPGSCRMARELGRLFKEVPVLSEGYVCGVCLQKKVHGSQKKGQLHKKKRSR